MKGILTGGAWDQTEVEVSEVPSEYVILGAPSVVYRCAQVLVEKGERVVLYEAAYDRSE